jgi:hypothetical protein
MNEAIAVYEIKFDHPAFASIICEDTATVLRIIENELECIEDLRGETLTFAITRKEMSKAAVEALPDAY